MDGTKEPTEATLTAHKENIESLIDLVASGRTSIRTELTDSIWAFERDTRAVAVRRQGKVIEAAIRGDLTFFKGDEPVWIGETHFQFV